MNIAQLLATGPVIKSGQPVRKIEVDGNAISLRQTERSDVRYRRAFEHFGFKATTTQIYSYLGITQSACFHTLQHMYDRGVVKRLEVGGGGRKPAQWEWIKGQETGPSQLED